jgi:hypothetical protein
MALEFLAAWLSAHPDGLSDYPRGGAGGDIYGPQPPPRPARTMPAMPPAAAHRESRASDVLGHVRATAAPTSEARPAQTELFASEARK